MNKEKANQLINKYYAGQTSLEEERQLREFLGRDDVPEDLQVHADQFRNYNDIRASNADDGFDPMAKINFEEEESRGIKSTATTTSLNWPLRIAAGFILLLIGYGAAVLMHSGDYASNGDVAELQQEVQQMKSALMNAGDYQYASAGERLSVINTSTKLTGGEQKLDRQISDILIYTMNNDDNINVRVAAAEALFRFRSDATIKKALIHSLNQQDAPLMQITLIDMLVELKAKSAVNEMEKMLVDADTRDIVRERLKTGIAQLKA